MINILALIIHAIVNNIVPTFTYCTWAIDKRFPKQFDRIIQRNRFAHWANRIGYNGV